ncbi:DUF4158 domain-containing protein [Streptosporangium sp. LJ11]|uniref:DUF4158 domain-containing protein n=1 Tax=Streptosporangium sp. LJ11 TaxID=3436927 RepID=UPI003F7B2CCE
MPAEFLSDEQRSAYATLSEMPSLPDMEKFFFLDAFDREVIARSRQDSHRLGVAIQIGTVRHKGLFLEDPPAVPWPVVDYLAEQLGIGDPSQVKRYGERPKTVYEHAWMICDVYGYHDFDYCSKSCRNRAWEVRSAEARLQRDIAAGAARSEPVREVIRQTVAQTRPAPSPAERSAPAVSAAAGWMALLQELAEQLREGELGRTGTTRSCTGA